MSERGWHCARTDNTRETSSKTVNSKRVSQSVKSRRETGGLSGRRRAIDLRTMRESDTGLGGEERNCGTAAVVIFKRSGDNLRENIKERIFAAEGEETKGLDNSDRGKARQSGKWAYHDGEDRKFCDTTSRRSLERTSKCARGGLWVDGRGVVRGAACSRRVDRVRLESSESRAKAVRWPECNNSEGIWENWVRVEYELWRTAIMRAHKVFRVSKPQVRDVKLVMRSCWEEFSEEDSSGLCTRECGVTSTIMIVTLSILSDAHHDMDLLIVS
ncbi:hypothetical protein Tco_0926771 [Tanacetum coccineum]|uniref:Uncharacterized protein n=1 Tax=Tanacetum coccineum TaxID=301880 RepID=A0ABQ5DBX8_9ASTR